MRAAGTVKWIALALLGLAIAGGVALAASRLASQQIGIASESIKAGKALAPTGLVNKGGGEKSGRGSRPRPEDREGPTETTPVTPSEPSTTTQQATPPEPTPEDHGGGEGGDD